VTAELVVQARVRSLATQLVQRGLLALLATAAQPRRVAKPSPQAKQAQRLLGQAQVRRVAVHCPRVPAPPAAARMALGPPEPAAACLASSPLACWQRQQLRPAWPSLWAWAPARYGVELALAPPVLPPSSEVLTDTPHQRLGLL
jgi:hypothetical protein